MKNVLPILLALTISQIASAQFVVRCMTYNIRYDTPSDSVNQWSNRKNKVYALISKYDPDIYGVQEAVHNQITDLAQNLSAYSYVGVGRDDGKTKGEYSAIFFKKDKFKIIKQGTFWLSKSPDVPGSKDWDAAITRVASWAIMKDINSSKEFLFLNTHFDHIGKEARRNSAAIIKEKIAALAGNLPAIMTGDFNTMRDDEPYGVIMKNTGLVLKDPAPADAPGTFCSFKVNSITCRAIDYIFYTSQWSPSAYQVIQENDGKYYPSDHLPVMATFSLSGK
ncbi:MAG: endonuclease/exonuclease/phosphatase family protein [Chryseolinea sp.]